MAISRLLLASVAAAAMAAMASGHVIGRRVDAGECTFTASPSDGDTCQSFADWWGITMADLKSYNPTLSCPSGSTLMPVQEWCVEMVLPPQVITTTSKTSAPTATGTGTPGPSPTQENVVKTCESYRPYSAATLGKPIFHGD